MHSLSLTGKRWKIVREQMPSTGAFLDVLRTERGIDDVAQPLPCAHSGLQPPDLLQACERLRCAVARGERIGIFGDYDCDGITGVAQMLRALRRRGAEPIVRLPHRQQDGYGLKRDAVEAFAALGVTLLVTVDTGVTALAEVGAARAAGMDVIIVDHHHLPAALPDALLIHPALSTEQGAHPSAAGMTFGFVSALEGGTWDDRDTDLALAAIGTVADLVELRGVNRSLVSAGLLALGRLRDGPLRELLSQSGITAAPTSRDVGFRIGPRINAAGRMADPSVALAALLGDGKALQSLEQLNQQRQSAVQEILRELATIDADAPFFCVASPDYAAGILGLIAGKLTERHGRPSMAAQVQGDMCVASLRSIPGFHVTQALEACRELLTTFGGHAQAAGCTFPVAALPELRNRMTELVLAAVPPGDLVPTLTIDAVLQPEHITLDFCRALATLEPFGQGNAEPRFLLRGTSFTTARRVGKDGAHLQATVGALKCIGFHHGPLHERLPGSIDVACRIGIDAWNGSLRPQLLIEDIREHQPALVPS